MTQSETSWRFREGVNFRRYVFQWWVCFTSREYDAHWFEKHFFTDGRTDLRVSRWNDYRMIVIYIVTDYFISRQAFFHFWTIDEKDPYDTNYENLRIIVLSIYWIDHKFWYRKNVHSSMQFSTTRIINIFILYYREDIFSRFIVEIIWVNEIQDENEMNKKKIRSSQLHTDHFSVHLFFFSMTDIEWMIIEISIYKKNWLFEIREDCIKSWIIRRISETINIFKIQVSSLWSSRERVVMNQKEKLHITQDVFVMKSLWSIIVNERHKSSWRSR